MSLINTFRKKNEKIESLKKENKVLKAQVQFFKKLLYDLNIKLK